MMMTTTKTTMMMTMMMMMMMMMMMTMPKSTLIMTMTKTTMMMMTTPKSTTMMTTTKTTMMTTPKSTMMMMMMLQSKITTYQSLTNEQNSGEKAWSVGNNGGSSCRTLVNTSKSVLQFLYGNSPVASSTWVNKIKQIPKLLSPSTCIWFSYGLNIFSRILVIYRQPVHLSLCFLTNSNWYLVRMCFNIVSSVFQCIQKSSTLQVLRFRVSNSPVRYLDSTHRLWYHSLDSLDQEGLFAQAKKQHNVQNIQLYCNMCNGISQHQNKSRFQTLPYWGCL